jgi:hypothetical protein
VWNEPVYAATIRSSNGPVGRYLQRKAIAGYVTAIYWCPVRNGLLRRSIRYTVTNNYATGGQLVARLQIIGVVPGTQIGAYYWPYQEFGTIYIKPRRFMQRGFDTMMIA